MATTAGVIGGRGSSSHSWIGMKGKKEKMERVKIYCASASAAIDPYKTLRIQPSASESEVKKAFRQLALQYHPDVCRGRKCGIEFSRINEAYDAVMSNLRGESRAGEMYDGIAGEAEWDLWEEWMGWEGAGIRDYSSHINPYI